MKRCFKCGQNKPIDQFYVHRQMADGHLNKCKECTKRDVQKHRRDNDSVRAYDRYRYNNNPNRKQHARDNAKRWREAYPDRYKAHYLLSNAVRDGRIKKPETCDVCGEVGNIHGHHDDYSRPLKVRWLCAKCHQRHHAEERKTSDERNSDGTE